MISSIIPDSKTILDIIKLPRLNHTMNELNSNVIYRILSGTLDISRYSEFSYMPEGSYYYDPIRFTQSKEKLRLIGYILNLEKDPTDTYHNYTVITSKRSIDNKISHTSRIIPGSLISKDI